MPPHVPRPAPAANAHDQIARILPGLAEPARAVAVLSLYVGLEWISFLHEHNELPVTPWNPGLGLMLAMILHAGPIYIGVLYAGVLLAELLVLRSALPLHVLLAIGAIVSAAYGAAALTVRNRLRLGGRTFGTRDILLLAGAALAAAVVSAALLCLLLLSVRHFGLNDIARTASPLVLGDVIGIAVVTPLVLRLLSGGLPLHRPSAASILEMIAFSVVIVLGLAYVTWPSGNQASLFYLLFPPVVIAAVRHGIDGATATLAVTQLALVGWLQLHGFDLTRFTEYQALMLALTLTGLVVGALVSERRRADEAAREAAVRLQALQSEAARTARLNLVSGMAAALAHEINQPMTAARALARSVEELLKRPDGDIARARTHAGAMIEQIDHAGAVVQRMREFLRRGAPRTSTLDLGPLLADAMALAQPLLRQHAIEWHLDLPERVPTVLGDRVQIQQVVINLVRNAVEAITDGGRSDGRIDVRVEAGDGGSHVEIAVVDNGVGIEPSRIATLFEPLSTSRPEGIGLGLSICRTIVQAHGGRIWLAASTPGRTEFRIRMPSGEATKTEA